MTTFDRRWNEALEALRERLLEDPGAADELRATRGRFGSRGEDPGRARDAERRHREWFCFERPSDALGGVPLDVLRDAVVRDDEADAGLFESLRGSRAGVFEVTSKDVSETLWCRDLLGLGEYPVREERAAHELEVGDLLVGRVYPVGDVFRLSPAMGVFRDAALVGALRGDLEAARAARRNTLRMSQEELERLFFGAGSGTREAARDPRADLLAAGLAAGQVDALLDELAAARAAGASGHAITELLNRLAFETEVDLGAVQRALLVAWADGAEANDGSYGDGDGAADAGEGGQGRTDVVARSHASEPAGPTRADVARALAAFDEGRRGGHDLEGLFQALEHELGLEDDADGDEGGPAPDFPGVVGAVVEEFLWEVAERDGDDAARPHEGLRLFAEFGREIGVFEELSPAHAREFFTRWLPRRGERVAPSAWPELVRSFAAFARWVEDAHQHPLWSSLEPELEALDATVERLRELDDVREPLTNAERFDVLRSVEDELLVRAADGEERTFRLSAARALVAGDRLELAMERGGRVRVGDVWPVLRAPEGA